VPTGHWVMPFARLRRGTYQQLVIRAPPSG
jgi:hypothetical protein